MRLKRKYFRGEVWCGKSESQVFPVLLTEHDAMKAYWGSGGIAPRIFVLGARWRKVVSFTARPLYPQE
jgi:hypothetical protein